MPDDARAYIRPLGKQQSTAPATKSAPVPSRRQTTPGRTSDPLASSKILRLPRNLRRRQTTPGRTSDPLARRKVLHLPRNLRRCPADARRRQGVHPTPWRAAKCCTCHEICTGAQPTPDDAKAYIRPLGKQQSTAPATKSAPVPSRRQTTPGRTSDPLASSKVLRLPRDLRRCPADARRRQGVHPTPWRAAKCCTCHEICAGAQPTPNDARAYIRPLGTQQSTAAALQTATVPSRRQMTPGRTSDPLASTNVLRLPRNLRRCPADARRRQGVHPTPWQAAKYCACHEICAGAQLTPDDARAYIRPLGKQQKKQEPLTTMWGKIVVI